MLGFGLNKKYQASIPPINTVPIDKAIKAVKGLTKKNKTAIIAISKSITTALNIVIPLLSLVITSSSS